MIMAEQSQQLEATDERSLPQRRFAGRAPQDTSVNVAQSERVISAVAGGALALAGLKMRSLPGVLLAAVGGGLVFRGATGHCPAYQSLGINTAEDERGPAAPEDYFERGIHVDVS